jgi:hypothetical protein
MEETRLVTVARRFLTDRSFALIVEPTIADVEFSPSGRRAGDLLAIARAIAGAAWEDATSGSGALTFFGLVLVPAAYFSVLLTLLAPVAVRDLSLAGHLPTVGAAIAALSLMPVLVCYWPDKRSARTDNVPADMP